MATTVTKTVKSSGGDYTSLSAFEAGEQRDLVTADEVAEAECYAFVDTTAVVFAGWTTDATRLVRVTTPDSERHPGSWDGGGTSYLLDADDTFAVVRFQDADFYGELIGLQIRNDTTSTNAGRRALRMEASGQNIDVRACLIRKDADAGTIVQDIGSDATQDLVLRMRNTVVFYGGGGAGSSIAGIEIKGWNHTTILYNVLVMNCATAIDVAGLSTSETFRAKNSATQNATAGWSIGNVETEDYATNIAEDGTAPGADAIQGAISFVDAANFDFHLDPTDTVALDAGTDLSADSAWAFSTDIDGETRSGTWDIGPDEIVTVVTLDNGRLADLAFARGRMPFGPGRLPAPDGTID